MRIWPRTVYDWGSTAREREQPFPCDRLIADPQATLFRCIDVDADRATVFRWLCQLRVAPYSYDRLDNGGRRSPQTLTTGLEHLAVGQRMMRIFRLVEFERPSSITVLSQGSLFGSVACTYRVAELAPTRSRLQVKLLLASVRGGPAAVAMRLLLPAGDLVMMRRQLLNLKGLAEAHPTGARQNSCRAPGAAG